MSKKKSCSDSGPPPSGDSIQINILDEKGIEIVHTKYTSRSKEDSVRQSAVPITVERNE